MIDTQKFRPKETVDAVQIVESNVDDLIEWIPAERAQRPGHVIAFKSWTCVWMLAKVGDWIVLDEHNQFRVVPRDEFVKHYEAA